MALGSLIELKAAIADWLNRDDLTSQITDFIVLAEAEILRRANVSVNFISIVTPTPLPIVTANIVLQAAPDLYLYGALKHAAPFLEHDERIPMWSAQFEKALTEYNEYARKQVVGSLITTYTELQTEVDNTLNSGVLTARVPTFIALCEATLKRRLRRLKIQATISLSGTSFDLTTLTIPCAEVLTLRLNTSTPHWNAPIRMVSDTTLSDYRALHGASGRPIHASVIGSSILFDRTLDATYSAEIIYYRAFATISGASPDYTILLQAPDLYLYGTLLQSAPYLGQDPRIPMWSSAFESALQELNTQRQREEFGGAPVEMRLPVVFG